LFLEFHTKDVEGSPLHLIFYLKGVLVRKEYFIINYLLPSPFNLIRGPILLGQERCTQASSKRIPP
jgi:hypothetical protein